MLKTDRKESRWILVGLEKFICSQGFYRICCKFGKWERNFATEFAYREMIIKLKGMDYRW